MTEIFECGDNSALVGYLYDECDAAERHAIEAHLAVCPACAAELAALGSTRLQLASWTPPEAELGFRIVSDATPPNVVRPVRWWEQPLPAWAQAAAACLIFGAGLWLGVARGSAPSLRPRRRARPSAPAAWSRLASRPDAPRPSRRSLSAPDAHEPCRHGRSSPDARASPGRQSSLAW